jgi:hypothetical protein
MAAKSVVAIPWYLRTDYAQAKVLFGDLPETYEVWLDRALRWEKDCQAERRAVARVVVHSGAFRTWCSENGIAADSNARTDFISRRAWALMQR